MRTRTAHKLATAGTISLLLWGAAASAQQVDTNPPLPNVLLLLDNSGSMERMINGNTPETDPNANTTSGNNGCNCKDNGPGTAPTCDWTHTLPTPNRWATVQQAFTGSLPNGFGCVAMPRTSGALSTFGTEYQIAGQPPYDTSYYLPFHRMATLDSSSGTNVACVFAPGDGTTGGSGLDGAKAGQGVGPQGSAVTSDNAEGFTGSCSNGQCSGSIVTREYGMLSTPVSCTFAQNNDGALTQMKDLMRFGLMTFDSDPDPGIGVTTPGLSINTTPFQGMWSYFPNWSSGGVCTESGNPVNCSSSTLLAVGARNPAAPAWEGRMVGFPGGYGQSFTNAISAQEQNNAEIAEVILATRPYGGTPMAGMFVGAQNYLWNDTNGPNSSTATIADPYAQGGCRPEFIILLTDGAPNLDMQTACSQAGGTDGGASGKCPFPLPQTTAATLYNNGVSASGKPSVKTFVIGFAVSTVTDGSATANCSQFSQASGGTPAGTLAGLCNCNSPGLASYVDPTYGPIGPCCELQCIAQAGGSTSAYFADTQGDLNNALGAILGSIASQATTRTTPSYSPVLSSSIANQSTATTAASVYLASLTPSVSQPWSGDIQRQEEQCSYSGTAYNVTSSINAANGDDFAQNLNSHSGPARNFIAFQPAVTGTGTVDATTTIRPYVLSTVGDNLGAYSATQFAGGAATVIPNITSAALAVPTTGCPYVSSTFGAGTKTLTAAQCATMLLDYTFGQSTFSGSPSDFTFVSRYNNALGDIFHANPIVVGPPGSLLQDPLYVAFQQYWQASPSNTNQSAWSTSTGGRKTVVYAATNDGLLHAFWADETKLENNEMWAMIPPAVMPNLISTYPSSHEFLLDGSPIVKDVVWDRNTGNTSTGQLSVWHTMLVASFGPYQQGYYAVDVTNPDPTGMGNGSVPADPPQTGPVFRWQLTKMPSTNYQLFASQSATPAITTIFMDPGDGQGARDIGVAILPGGQNGNPTSSLGNGSSCARAAKASDSAPPTGYAYRSAVRCWGTYHSPPQATDPVIGRSVTIVRLDTGEILRTFARKADANPPYASNDTLLNAGRIIDTPLDSPMTGTPLVFPTDVGADTTKFFIGDADGTIWKFDVTSSNPSNWTGELFLDLYNTTVDPTTTTSWGDGQPFQVTPILSLDTAGELVINAATGSIQSFDTSGIELVYSITEKVQGNPAKLRANVNWWLGPIGLNGATLGFQQGERVSGPMTVFNGTLYFSTYAAASTNSTSCTSGVASLWGRNYVTPDNTSDLSQGGVRVLQPPPPASPTTPPPVSVQPAVQAGAVIPGVSIMATPACAGLGAAGADQYVAGASHQTPQNFAAGGFSLFTQVGAKGTSGSAATQQFQTSVQTPASPTSIDSWASVLE